MRGLHYEWSLAAPMTTQRRGRYSGRGDGMGGKGREKGEGAKEGRARRGGSADVKGRMGDGGAVNGVAVAAVILMVSLAPLAVLGYYTKYVELLYEEGK